jgi:hypothetical protein
MHHTNPPGRLRKTTDDQDFQITLSSIEDPWKSIAEIKSYLDLDILNSIISQRLTESKLYSCVARQKTKLSPMHRACRKRFAERYLDFNRWGRTVFVDESTFQSCQAWNTLVRRPIGCAYKEQYVQMVENTGRKSVPVFGLMRALSFGPLIRLDNHFKKEDYFDVLNGYVLPFIEEEFGDYFYYYQVVNGTKQRFKFRFGSSDRGLSLDSGYSFNS